MLETELTAKPGSTQNKNREAASLASGVMDMLGAMVATRENNHISIDAVSRYLPLQWRSYASVVTRLIAAVVCAVVAWYSFEFVRFEYEDQTLAFASVPNWMCQIILPAGFAVMSARFLLLVLKALRVAVQGGT